MDIFKRFRKKQKEPPTALDNAMFCLRYYGKTIKDKAHPCPIHGSEPIVLIDITKSPHEGIVMCRTFGCEMGAITGDPHEVIKQWNEKCEKEELHGTDQN